MPITFRALILSVLFAPALFAADWPQWRGPNRDGHVPDGVPVPTSLPDSPKILWRQKAGFAVASPVVGGGKTVYLDNTADKEVVHAVDAATGAPAWSIELDDVHKDSQTAPGPRCTPLIDADRVYAQSGRGHLKCLSLAEGKLIWQTDYVKEFGATFIGEKGEAQGAIRHGYTATPLIDGDHLICETGGPGAGITCFEKQTGKVVWKSQDDVPAYAAPIIATVAGKRQMICYTVNGVLGLDPIDGKPLWRDAVKTKFARHAATPVVVGTDMIVVSSHEVGLMGIRISADGDSLKAERAWTNKPIAINFASPVAVGDYVYGVGPQKNIICVEAKTGKLAWSKDGYFTSPAGKAYAGIIVVGPNLLILTDGGQLVMLAADPKAAREVAKARVAGANWCNPAYADGRLYLRDDKEVLCVELMR